MRQKFYSCKCGTTTTVDPLPKCFKCCCGEDVHSTYEFLYHEEHAVRVSHVPPPTLIKIAEVIARNALRGYFNTIKIKSSGYSNSIHAVQTEMLSIGPIFKDQPDSPSIVDVSEQLAIAAIRLYDPLLKTLDRSDLEIATEKVRIALLTIGLVKIVKNISKSDDFYTHTICKSCDLYRLNKFIGSSGICDICIEMQFPSD